MLAQMAATASSVAVGSTLGHGLSSMLFGGREAPAEQQQQQAPPMQQYQAQNSGLSCDFQAKGESQVRFEGVLGRLMYVCEQSLQSAWKTTISIRADGTSSNSRL
jgi:hypothetical protein